MGNMKKNDQIQEILNKRHKIIFCVEEDHIHNTKYQKKDRLVNQRVMWDDLKKNINHLVNKINSSNFKDVTKQLLSLNLLWGRGLFCNAVLKSVYSSSSVSESLLASVIAVVNTVFPDVGYLLVKRALIRFGNYLENRDEIELISIVKFLGYLISHRVVDKQLGLEMMYKLTQLEIKGNIGLCQEIILKEGNLRLSEDQNTANDSWDFVEVDDQVTHEISMLHELDEERDLNVFRPDTNFASDDELIEPLRLRMS